MVMVRLGDAKAKPSAAAPLLVAMVLVGLTAVLALGESTTSLLALALGLTAAVLAAAAPGWVLLAGTLAQIAVLAAGPWPWAGWPARLNDSFEQWPVTLWHRFEIWDHGALAAVAKPWFGWGFSGYREVPKTLAPTETYRYFVEADPPPQCVFTIMVELGVWGALAGGLVVLAVARAIWAAAVGAPDRYRHLRGHRDRCHRRLWRVASQLVGDHWFRDDLAGGGGRDCRAAQLSRVQFTAEEWSNRWSDAPPTPHARPGCRQARSAAQR